MGCAKTRRRTVHLVLMLKQAPILLPPGTLQKISAISESNPNIRLDVRTYFNLFVPLVVNALRLAFDTKRELLYIIYILFPRYLVPLIAAIENGCEPPCTYQTVLFPSGFDSRLNCHLDRLHTLTTTIPVSNYRCFVIALIFLPTTTLLYADVCSALARLLVRSSLPVYSI